MLNKKIIIFAMTAIFCLAHTPSYVLAKPSVKSAQTKVNISSSFVITSFLGIVLTALFVYFMKHHFTNRPPNDPNTKSGKKPDKPPYHGKDEKDDDDDDNNDDDNNKKHNSGSESDSIDDDENDPKAQAKLLFEANTKAAIEKSLRPPDQDPRNHSMEQDSQNNNQSKGSPTSSAASSNNSIATIAANLIQQQAQELERFKKLQKEKEMNKASGSLALAKVVENNIEKEVRHRSFNELTKNNEQQLGSLTDNNNNTPASDASGIFIDTDLDQTIAASIAEEEFCASNEQPRRQKPGSRTNNNNNVNGNAEHTLVDRRTERRNQNNNNNNDSATSSQRPSKPTRSPTVSYQENDQNLQAALELSRQEAQKHRVPTVEDLDREQVAKVTALSIEEKKREDKNKPLQEKRQVVAEQDAEYAESLRKDREKDRKRAEEEAAAKKKAEAEAQFEADARENAVKLEREMLANKEKDEEKRKQEEQTKKELAEKEAQEKLKQEEERKREEAKVIANQKEEARLARLALFEKNKNKPTATDNAQ